MNQLESNMAGLFGSRVRVHRNHRWGYRARLCTAVLAAAWSASAAHAADKPPPGADPAPSLATESRISATIEFSLSTLAAAIERDIPKRLVTIDERINCVHRRVLGFQVNANCDVWGYVERSSGVSLYGRDNRVFGAVSIHGVAEGQGANRFTSRIKGETEASATIEAEARPHLQQDWSLDLGFSDSFHWSEAPYLHVLGREIALAPYVEPRIRGQLSRVRSRALAAARRLDLHDKAATAWSRAFEPIKLADEPQVWLQLTPQSASFAGVRANAKNLSGSLELLGTAQTTVGQPPPPVSPTALPPLGKDVSAPGTFDVILPVRVSYDTLRDKLMAAIAAGPKNDKAIREVQLYPSAGKLVIGLRVATGPDAAADAGEWVYLSARPNVDADKRTVGLQDIGVDDATSEKLRSLFGDGQLITQLKEASGVDYGIAYDNLLNAANQRLTRPLAGGFRMEGNLTSAKLENVSLLADGLTIALHASGELKILYGL